ncbi:hypothetical protein [Streptomyces sp. RKAG293]|uniref:hypothetical protein n=1 Tax=Streptomyces sp. RKAG293 TaxID=2893403 RepID=UPI00203453DE|nr:hypothetical protein [Streptomyces sp. RKAG293]MCM2416583.1 hypothetical protein [Streptomyces sp. RKAG293]
MSDQFSSSGPDAQPFDEIRIRKGKRALVASADSISIGEQVFRLDSVDRVFYRAAARINQASYTIGLAQGERKCTFMFDAYRRGSELEDARATWRQLVGLIQASVCPRIAEESARRVLAGETVTFGGPASSRIDADSQGLRPRRLFGKTVPWLQIANAEFAEGMVRIWSASDGAVHEKPTMSVDMSGWNAVVLPEIVRHFAGR